MKAWTLISCALVNGYLLGVMVLFATVVYPGFEAVPRNAFPQFYSAFTARIPIPVVVFEFAALLTTLLLYISRPAAVSLMAVHGLLILGVLYFVITFAWHLPAHRALAQGDNGTTALAPLLQSQWARTGVQIIRVGALAWLCVRGRLNA